MQSELTVPPNSQTCAHPKTHSLLCKLTQICHPAHHSYYPYPRIPTVVSLFLAAWSPTHLSSPTAARCQVPTLRPISRPLSPTSASHFLICIRSVCSKHLFPGAHPQTAPDSHSQEHWGSSAGHTSRKSGGRGEQQESLAERSAERSGHGHQAAARGLRGPRAELGAQAAPAALKFPGRGREAQPHSLQKCAVGSNPQ